MPRTLLHVLAANSATVTPDQAKLLVDLAVARRDMAAITAAAWRLTAEDARAVLDAAPTAAITAATLKGLHPDTLHAIDDLVATHVTADSPVACREALASREQLPRRHAETLLATGHRRTLCELLIRDDIGPDVALQLVRDHTPTSTLNGPQQRRLVHHLTTAGSAVTIEALRLLTGQGQADSVIGRDLTTRLRFKVAAYRRQISGPVPFTADSLATLIGLLPGIDDRYNVAAALRRIDPSHPLPDTVDTDLHTAIGTGSRQALETAVANQTRPIVDLIGLWPTDPATGRPHDGDHLAADIIKRLPADRTAETTADDIATILAIPGTGHAAARAVIDMRCDTALTAAVTAWADSDRLGLLLELWPVHEPARTARVLAGVPDPARRHMKAKLHRAGITVDIPDQTSAGGPAEPTVNLHAFGADSRDLDRQATAAMVAAVMDTIDSVDTLQLLLDITERADVTNLGDAVAMVGAIR